MQGLRQLGESHIALVRGDLCADCPAVHDGPFGHAGPEAHGGSGVNGAVDTGQTRPGVPCPHAVLVRVHTRCTAGDVFAADCRCRETLDESMRMIAEEGCGVVLYLHNTSRGFEIERTPVEARPFEPGGGVVLHAGPEASGGRLILHQELRTREGDRKSVV